MTQQAHTDIAVGAPANASTFNAPLGTLDNALVDLELLSGDYVITGGLPGTSASLVITQPAIRAWITNIWTNVAGTSLTMTATKDNYVDLDATGAYHVTPVTIAAAAPAIFAGSIRLYKAVTSGTAVTSVVDLRPSPSSSVDTNVADYQPIGNSFVAGATGKAMDAGTVLAHPLGLAQDAHHTAAHADTPALSALVHVNSNGADISSFLGSGVLNIQTNPTTVGFQPVGTVQATTNKGIFPVQYTGINNAIPGQFTGCTALGSPPAASNLSTGNSVSTPATHLGPNKVNVGRVAGASPSTFLGPDSQQRQLGFRTDVLAAVLASITDDATNGVANILLRIREFMATDHGLLAWSFDPGAVTNGLAPGVAGTVQLTRIHVPVALPVVTNVALAVQTAGATLTAGQNFAALFGPVALNGAVAGAALIGTTADQAAAWVSTGPKIAALVGGPYALAAGDYFVAMFANGTTLPKFQAGNANGASANIGLATTNARFMTDTTNTARTTTMPATVGAVAVAAANAYFVGIS